MKTVSIKFHFQVTLSTIYAGKFDSWTIHEEFRSLSRVFYSTKDPSEWIHGECLPSSAGNHFTDRDIEVI